MSQTVWQILEAGRDDAHAIGAPGRAWLTAAGLRELARGVVARLNEIGIGRNDRVAMVLPNGPEAATAFLAVACGATAAPLNPAYREDEFAFYLEDLKPKALIVLAGEATPAREVAARLHIRLIELQPLAEAAAGSFVLEIGEAGAPGENFGPSDPDDTALVLHTSGTTARPKIVPLTNRNVAASAGHIAESLALTPGDVCLNVMPLFHIHGLIAAVLSSLSAGASVCCTGGFNALRFLSLVDQVKPTWYTAVPTMHQAILMRARQNVAQAQGAKLRFIRSSSASLPPPVMVELEEVFAAPVIEAYGMTEAAHQMASNPLPPRARKAGCVGLAAGPEIAIMDDDGVLLSRGGVGEVVIRGPNVTLGYEANPEANAKAFTDGWFRTGDQGMLDDEGYLFLTGRLKEQINRGGEKISPLEIDNVLLEHPAIAQVVTFAMPHDKLGEEVAAAVVLREGFAASEQEIRDFCGKKLAAFKVPRRVLFMDDIPKGATGKLTRIGLAQKLGLTG
jgi:acyl-CoA synthetase (AMP-forming)/AMP-acid ligase II